MTLYSAQLTPWEAQSFFLLEVLLFDAQLINKLDWVVQIKRIGGKRSSWSSAIATQPHPHPPNICIGCLKFNSATKATSAYEDVVCQCWPLMWFSEPKTTLKFSARHRSKVTLWQDSWQGLLGDCLGTQGACGMGLNLGSKLEYGRFKIKLLATNYTKQGISSDLVIVSKEFCLASAL